MTMREAIKKIIERVKNKDIPDDIEVIEDVNRIRLRFLALEVDIYFVQDKPYSVIFKGIEPYLFEAFFHKMLYNENGIDIIEKEGLH